MFLRCSSFHEVCLSGWIRVISSAKSSWLLQIENIIKSQITAIVFIIWTTCLAQKLELKKFCFRPNTIRFLHRHPRSLFAIDITSHEKVWINWTRCESNGPNLDNTHMGFLIFICDLRGEKRSYKSVAKEISKPPFFWLLKSSGYQSLPCLFDSRSLSAFIST